MKKLTLEMETVTPLFLGGANPREAPELRPPSFRGAMRYWLRALIGSTYQGIVQDVRREEGKVFGIALEGTSRASAISLHTMTIQTKETGYSSMIKDKIGLGYLFFAARSTKNESERLGLEGRFNLCITARFGTSEEIWLRACASLWLLTHFGGVGTRVHRGAGAFQPSNLEECNSYPQGLPPLSIRATNANEFVDELGSGLNHIRSIVGASTTLPLGLPEFDIIDPRICRVWVISKKQQVPFDSWDSALNEIGLTFQQFRSRRTPDYDTVKTSIKQRERLDKPVARSAFGLPIPYFYKSLGNMTATLSAENHDRRSSPLWFRVIKLSGGKYVVVCLWFKSQFLPSGEKLKLKLDNRNSVLGDQSPDDLIEKFLTKADAHRPTLFSSFDTQEVHYA